MILSSFLLALELPIPESSGWQMTGSYVSFPTSGCAPSLINQFIVFVSVSCCMFRGQFYRVDHLPPFHWFRAQTPVARLARQAKRFTG